MVNAVKLNTRTKKACVLAWTLHWTHWKVGFKSGWEPQLPPKPACQAYMEKSRGACVLFWILCKPVHGCQMLLMVLHMGTVSYIHQPFARSHAMICLLLPQNMLFPITGCPATWYTVSTLELGHPIIPNQISMKSTCSELCHSDREGATWMNRHKQ